MFNYNLKYFIFKSFKYDYDSKYMHKIILKYPQQFGSNIYCFIFENNNDTNHWQMGLLTPTNILIKKTRSSGKYDYVPKSTRMYIANPAKLILH